MLLKSNTVSNFSATSEKSFSNMWEYILSVVKMFECPNLPLITWKYNSTLNGYTGIGAGIIIIGLGLYMIISTKKIYKVIIICIKICEKEITSCE